MTLALLIAGAAYLAGGVFITCLFRADNKRRDEPASWKGYLLLFFGWPVLGFIAAVQTFGDRHG